MPCAIAGGGGRGVVKSKPKKEVGWRQVCGGGVRSFAVDGCNGGCTHSTSCCVGKQWLVQTAGQFFDRVPTFPYGACNFFTTTKHSTISYIIPYER